MIAVLGSNTDQNHRLTVGELILNWYSSLFSSWWDEDLFCFLLHFLSFSQACNFMFMIIDKYILYERTQENQVTRTSRSSLQRQCAAKLL